MRTRHRMPRMVRLLPALALAGLVLPVACTTSDNTAINGVSQGHMVVQLTDAPFSSDSVRSVTIYVVRVDARTTAADSAAAAQGASDDSASMNGWATVATPNTSYDLLSLQHGVAATLGEADLPAGTYNGFRLVIDPTRSSVTLKNGMVLTGSTNPGVTFPSASRSGLKIVLSQPVTVVANTTTTLLVDFDVNNSFVMRGNSITQNGLLFKPVIHATVTNTALTNATVRLANATGTALDMLENGTSLSGATNVAFGASSVCTSVPAATPGLTVVTTGTTTPLTGLTLSLNAGNSYTVVAYPTATGGVQFTTLGNAFTATSGDAGLRVFNATTGATGYDVYLTPTGTVSGTATVSNVGVGAASSFTSVAAGSPQIVLTSTGTTNVLLNLGAQTLTAGQNETLIIAPPAAGSTTPRAFLVSGC